MLILPDGGEHPLRADTSVGRDEANEVRLASKTVSRRHALIVFREGRWWIADTGSFNGTFLNDRRLPPGVALQLRHADRIRMGSEVLLFSAPDQLADADSTEPHADAAAPIESRGLSPLQERVVRCLCRSWLEGGTLDELPSNEEIARELGTPGAVDTVKAALRRAYAKAGLTSGSPYAKRRTLCRVARQRSWI